MIEFNSRLPDFCQLVAGPISLSAWREMPLLYCAMRCRQVSTFGLIYRLSFDDFYFRLGVHGVFRPFSIRGYLGLKGYKDIGSSSAFNFDFGPFALYVKHSSKWSNARYSIDTGTFYKTNTAPWAKGRRQ